MAFGRVSGETRLILDSAVLLARAAFMLGWLQIQLDLANVQKLWFFQATLRGFPDGESQMRLDPDRQVLPPASPRPKDVAQQPFDWARCFVLEPEHCCQKYARSSVK